MYAELENGRIIIFDSYMAKETIKEIDGRVWDAGRKVWSIPANGVNVETLEIIGCSLSEELNVFIKFKHHSFSRKNQSPIKPMPIKANPYQHQIKGYNLACISMGIINNDNFKSPGYALLMEMGTGKTITTIAIAGRALLSGKAKRLLILAPKSIVNVWSEEFEKFADYYCSLCVLQGCSTEKIKVLESIPHLGLEVAVVNYDSVALIEKELLAWSPDFIVCDESSKVKNPSAKMSKATHRIAKQCKYRLILTGTPIQNNPLDFYSQYKILDESIFGKSYFAFKNQYAVLGLYNQPVGWRNLPELIKKAHSIAFRVTKEDALDLPDTIDEIRPVFLEKKALTLYKQFVRDSYIELSKGEVSATNILTRMLRLQQLTGGFIRPDEESDRYEQVSKAKLEALEDIVDSANEAGQKVVIIARFIPEIKEICKLLDSKKISYARICGDVKDRAAEVDRFQNDKKCMVFVGQIQTVSMGLTLTASSTMVFYSLSYNFADYSQARARIHRIGQKNKCLYIHLTVKDTIDETVLQVLRRKDDISHSIVDNWREIIK